MLVLVSVYVCVTKGALRTVFGCPNKLGCTGAPSSVSFVRWVVVNTAAAAAGRHRLVQRHLLHEGASCLPPSVHAGSLGRLIHSLKQLRTYFFFSLSELKTAAFFAQCS